MSLPNFLDPTATLFERALTRAVADEFPITLRDVLNPALTPVPFLPFLAAHESVDLWFSDWSEERKRQMVANAITLAALKGTSAAAAAFLAYVDGEIIHKLTHPTRFVVGRSGLGRTPIGHKPFHTHFLVRVPLKRPANSFIVGRSAVQRAGVRSPDREPLRRASLALVASKAPETAYSVNFGHRRPVTLDDGFPLDGSFRFGSFKDRERL